MYSEYRISFLGGPGRPSSPATRLRIMSAKRTRRSSTGEAMHPFSSSASVQEDYAGRCPICLDPAQDPYLTACRHRFCGVCIKRALGIKKECPACRAPIASHRKLVREMADNKWEAYIPGDLKLSAGAQEALASLPPGTRVAVPTQQPSEAAQPAEPAKADEASEDVEEGRPLRGRVVKASKRRRVSLGGGSTLPHTQSTHLISRQHVGSGGGGSGKPAAACDASAGLAACKAAVAGIARRQDAAAFLDPVDWEFFGLDDYPQIVPHPMDLGTVLGRLEAGAYPTVVEACADVDLIWSNCMAYNQSDSRVCKDAVRHPGC